MSQPPITGDQISLTGVDGSGLLNVNATTLGFAGLGVGVGDILQLVNVGGGSPENPGFPALDGSLLTDLDATNITSGILDATHLPDIPGSPSVAGSYTNADITVDAKGRVTAAANGSGGSGSVPLYEVQSASAGSPLQTIFTTTIVPTMTNGGSPSQCRLQVFVNGLYQLEGVAKSYQVTGANQITFNEGVPANADVVFIAF